MELSFHANILSFLAQVVMWALRVCVTLHAQLAAADLGMALD